MKKTIFLLMSTLILNCVMAQTGSYSYQVINSESINKEIEKIASDDDDNIIVTGAFQFSITFGSTTLISSAPSPYNRNAAFIAKMNSNYSVTWAKKFDPLSIPSGESNVFIYGLTTDASGNIYVTGSFTGKVKFISVTLTSQKDGPYFTGDMFTAKITASGNLSWVKAEGTQFHACGGGDFGRSVTVDNAGNAVATGQLIVNLLPTDPSCNINCPEGTPKPLACIYVVRYTSSGKKSWEKKYFDTSVSTGACVTNSFGTSIRSDGTNFYVAGNMYGSITFGNITLSTGDGSTSNAFLLKLGSNGQTLFAKSISGSNNVTYLVGEGQCFIINNEIYVSGLFYPNGVITSGGCGLTFDSLNNYLFKFNSSGECLWDQVYQGIIYGAVLNPAGNISMISRFGGLAGFMPFGIREISSADGSTLEFVKAIFPEPNPVLSFWSGPAATSDGFIFCQNLHGSYDLGTTTITSLGPDYEDFVLVRYTADVSPAETSIFNDDVNAGQDYSQDFRTLIPQDKAEEMNPGQSEEIEKPNDQNRVLLEKNDKDVVLYPNPAKDNIKISCVDVISEIRIFSAQGYEVRSLKISEDLREIILDDLPAGMYFLIINSGGSKITEKFIKL